MPSISVATIVPARRVRGRLTVPGDKSISHRYAILAALAQGRSTITNFAPGADCRSTQLRVERSGCGNGRVYTVFLHVTDLVGNRTDTTVKVLVPDAVVFSPELVTVKATDWTVINYSYMTLSQSGPRPGH